jgi:hypothetical protein
MAAILILQSWMGARESESDRLESGLTPNDEPL